MDIALANLSAGLCRDDLAVNFPRELLDALGQPFHGFGELGVLSHHFEEQRLLLRGESLAFLAGTMQVFAVLGIGDGVRLVPVGLPGLRQENERRGVGGLKVESARTTMP